MKGKRFSVLAMFAYIKYAHVIEKERTVKMDRKKFIEPKEIEIDGNKFIISKIPAIQAQQIYRMIMKESKDDGDVAMTYLTEETAVALLSYSALGTEEDGIDSWTILESTNAINALCGEINVLIKLEAAMIRYNFGFLFDGSLLKVLELLRDGNQDT